MPVLRVAALCGLVLATLSVIISPSQVEARPQYLKEFATKYEKLKEASTKEKCNVCHFGKTKKNLNDYGTALSTKLGAKNVKDVAVITKAYVDAEPEKSKVEEKTFGDLIKEGKLPGTSPESAE